MSSLQQLSTLPTSNPVDNVQIISWNDYEAGSQIEAGIDNCVFITPTLAADTLSWQVTGNTDTIDHYAVFASTDGTNLTLIAKTTPATNSLALGNLNLTAGTQYTMYVQAVGKPSVLNKISPPASYTPVTKQAPVIQLAVSPTSGVAPLAVSSSITSSGTIVSNSIDFGDGTVINFASGSHTYASAGTYTVTATVTDNLGRSSSATATVSVAAANQPPVAKLSVTPTSGTAPVTVSASTAGSTDPNTGGAIASSVINFGDGTVVNTASGTHAYTTAGTYTVTATVTDNLGLSSSATATVSVAAPNQPPVAQLPTISGVTVSSVTTTGATVTWNTSAATDGLVAWGYNAGFDTADSGVFDSAGATSHSYTISGLYPGRNVSFFLRSRPTPGGVLDTVQTHWAVVGANGCVSPAVCAFTTSDIPAGSFDYYVNFQGPQNMVQGYDTYIRMNVGVLQGTYTARALTMTLSGLPPYTSLQWTEKQQWGIGADVVAGNAITFYGLIVSSGGYDFHLTTNVGGTTPTGAYTITATGTGTGLPTHSATWTLNVNAPGTGFTAGTPSSYPAIPCLAAGSTMVGGGACAYNWTDTMDVYGQFWYAEDEDFTVTGTTPACTYPAPLPSYPSRCIRPDDATNLTPVGSLQYEPWFYDGVLVYQQIGNYQNNPAKWAQAVANVMQVYRDGYLLPNNGALQGYMIFTEGLYRDYIATGTAADLTAIDDVDLNSSYAQSAGGAFSSTVYQREAVYMLEADLWASKLNNPVKYSQPASYWLQYDVAHVLGMIDQQCGQTPTQPYEYFMAGLQAEALIKYYINTGSTDVRIPAAVKQLADCIWSSGWGATADDLLAFPYNSNFAEYGVTLVASGGYGGAELNLLVAPMYAWLYKMTGNTTYQTEGDAIWQSGVLMADGGGVPGTIGWTGNGGKQFSQNYRWSFDYVNWRSTP